MQEGSFRSLKRGIFVAVGFLFFFPATSIDERVRCVHAQRQIPKELVLEGPRGAANAERALIFKECRHGVGEVAIAVAPKLVQLASCAGSLQRA